MRIQGPDGAREGDLHEGEEPGEHHRMVVRLHSRNIYMRIQGPDGASEGDLHEEEEPGDHHRFVVRLRSRNIHMGISRIFLFFVANGVYFYSTLF